VWFNTHHYPSKEDFDMRTFQFSAAGRSAKFGLVVDGRDTRLVHAASGTLVAVLPRPADCPLARAWLWSMIDNAFAGQPRLFWDAVERQC
jgi:hypothetical protein